MQTWVEARETESGFQEWLNEAFGGQPIEDEGGRAIPGSEQPTDQDRRSRLAWNAEELRSVQGIARGQAMTLVPHGKELTTQQAADLLHVSRPHLVKLLDEDTIPHYKVGTHRRVRIEDALAYRQARASVRRDKLDELTRLSEELEGGYR